MGSYKQRFSGDCFYLLLYTYACVELVIQKQQSEKSCSPGMLSIQSRFSLEKNACIPCSM